MKVYFHIPKTGGSSLKKIFERHSNIQTIGHVHGLTEKLMHESFTVVRNPYSRTLSTYNYLVTGGDGNSSDLRDQKIWLQGYNGTPEDFSRFVKNDLYRIKTQQQHFLPLLAFTHFEGKLLLDWYVKLEELADKWTKVCKKLEINDTLIKVNEGKVKVQNKNEWLTQEVKEIIYREYKQDFEVFEYNK